MRKPRSTRQVLCFASLISGALCIAVAVAAASLSTQPAFAISSVASTSSVVPTASVLPSTTPKPFVVVIDPGHQAKADLKTEPIGPGSKTRKPRVEGGATGVATHRPESLDNLQIALKLRDDLVKQGVKVIMIRTTQNVDIANSKRAQIANAAHANLFIRLHCDSSTQPSISGVLTLVPATNKWTSHATKSSARAGRDVENATLKATRAKNRGITRRGDLSGFNWCKVPTALIEMGVMSNPAEDRRLASASYQRTLAVGITNGIMSFLRGK